MDTIASADIHLAMDWLRLPYNYKYQALEALDRAILELRRDEKAPSGTVLFEDPPAVKDLLDKVGGILTHFRSLDPTKEELRRPDDGETLSERHIIRMRDHLDRQQVAPPDEQAAFGGPAGLPFPSQPDESIRLGGP